MPEPWNKKTSQLCTEVLRIFPGDLSENLTNPLNLAKFTYSASTLYCMTTSLAEGGAGIGTCMGAAGPIRWGSARSAGFRSRTRSP